MVRTRKWHTWYSRVCHWLLIVVSFLRLPSNEDEPIKMYDSAYSTNSNNLYFFSEFLLTRITDIFRKIIWKHILLNINLCLINFCPGENPPRSTSTFAWNQRQTLQCTYKPARGVLPMTGILLCSCVRFPLRQFTRHKCSLNILEFSSNECLS